MHMLDFHSERQTVLTLTINLRCLRDWLAPGTFDNCALKSLLIERCLARGNARVLFLSLIRSLRLLRDKDRVKDR